MKKIIFFLAISILVSCTSNTIYKAPKDLIPKDTMVLLLSDMILANSAQYKKNEKLQKLHYMPWVYEKYKIDSTRLKKSNTYYISTIDGYGPIFEEIKINFEVQKKKYASLKKEKDSIRKDSLRKWESPIKKGFKIKKGLKKFDIEKLGKRKVLQKKDLLKKSRE